MSKQELTATETSKRNTLQERKPLAYQKIIQYPKLLSLGKAACVIDFGYNNICNLKCKHCFASKLSVKARVMTLADVVDLAGQADEYGLAQFNITGGEPLVFDDIDELIEALMPNRFHLSMSTNGLLLTPERAKHLAHIGLDKVKISVDSINETMHDANRNRSGSYQKAMNALNAAKDAGLQVVMQHCVTHYTAKSKELVELCEFGAKHGYQLDIVIARAMGEWEGRDDVLIDKDDAEALIRLHEKYPHASRDVFSHYGVPLGCGAVNRNLHITKYGDVMPCGYIQISIGNIFEEPFAKILERGMNIRHFAEFNPLCLSGEDRSFMKNYIQKYSSDIIPVDYRDIFTAEDYIDQSKV